MRSVLWFLGALLVLGCGDDQSALLEEGSAGAGNGSAQGGAGQPAGGGSAGDTAIDGGAHTGGSSAVGGGSSTAGASGAGGTDDPCAGTPASGECVSSTEARYCVLPTGDGQPSLVTVTCDGGRVCVSDEKGTSCRYPSGACAEGSTRCADSVTLEICEGGTWTSGRCSVACQDSALGGFCAYDLATKTYTATVNYDARGPNAAVTDWATTTFSAPARDVLVLSMRGEDILDAQMTSATGSFQVKVPDPVQAGDSIILMPIHPSVDGSSLEFAVAEPQVADGEQEVPLPSGTQIMFWQWSIDPTKTASGSTLRITEALGSGALRVYDSMRRGVMFAQAKYGAAGLSTIAWLRMNTSWSCGACFVTLPMTAGSIAFDSQIFFSATAQDQAFWADPVTVHELGHWAMQSFGVSPQEGGPHCLGVPTFPGQAWSEGWATAYSSIARGSELYYDKQNGTMFWIDLSARAYSSGTWVKPKPADGLLQKMDENEVAAIVWQLAGQSALGTDAVVQALAKPRMISSAWPRGYTRRTWSLTPLCEARKVEDTGEPVPMLAEYLDALRCNGAPASTIDAVVSPSTSYPYPSAAPLCE